MYHVPQLIKLIEKALKHKGFSFVDVADICPTYFGRKNKVPTPVAMMEKIRDMSITVKTAEKLSAEELSGKIVIGEFYEENALEFTEEYAKIIKTAQGGK